MLREGDLIINEHKLINQLKTRKQEIAYELANHEAYYTGDISDTMEALGKDYTEAEVLEVYRAERKKTILDKQWRIRHLYKIVDKM